LASGRGACGKADEIGPYLTEILNSYSWKEQAAWSPSIATLNLSA
jgi:hypothetical protein